MFISERFVLVNQGLCIFVCISFYFEVKSLSMHVKMIIMKTKKLLLTTLFLSVILSAGSQVVYTNIHDVAWHITGAGYSASVDLDIDHDGIDDFRITLAKSGTPQYPGQAFSIHSLNGDSIKIDEEYPWAYATRCAWHDINDTISSSPMWDGERAEFYYYNWKQNLTMGYWNKNEIGYAGFKLIRNDGVHYGWIRAYYLDPNSIIYDYAYECQPDKPIIIGEGIDNKVQIYNVEDVSDFGNGKDLLIEYDKIFYYDSMQFYRVFVVKSDSAANFTLEKANQVPPENYYILPVTSSNKSIRLFEYSKDVDGEFIGNNIPYRIFVMTTAYSGIPVENELSLPSEEIMLKTIVPTATDLVAYDGGESGNASDLTVRFFGPEAHENLVDEYRMIAIQRDSIINFTAEQAMMLPETHYGTVLPDGSDEYLGNFDQNTLDCYGNPIVPDKAYFVKILSAPNESYTTIGSLSDSSTIIALHVPSFLKAGEMDPSRIVYYDLPNPYPGYLSPVYLDIDENNIYDFEFEFIEEWTPSWRNATIAYTYDHSLINCNGAYTLKLPDSTMISKYSFSWCNQGIFYNDYYTIDNCLGYWQEPGYGYTGLRVVADGDTIYSWIKIYTYCSGNLVLLEYANFKNDIVKVDEHLQSNFSITPNPVIDVAELRTRVPVQNEAIVDVVNLMGEHCLSVNISKGQTRTNLDFSGLHCGIYIVRVSCGDENQVLKILKQ